MLKKIADICAYNIFRQFALYGREWMGRKKNNDGLSAMSMYPYFDKIRCNFLFNPLNNQVRGVGLTCVPDFDKVNWNLLKGCF